MEDYNDKRIIRRDWRLYSSREDGAPDFNPQYLIHGVIDVTMVGNDMKVGYLAIFTYDLDDPSTLAAFVEGRRGARNVTRAKMKQAAANMALPLGDKPLRTPLDFGCNEDCYVVLELNVDRVNWNFRSVYPVTTKHDMGDLYFDLQSYTDDTGYGLLSFCARSRVDGDPFPEYSDSINIHVVLSKQKDETQIELVFDPDIQNPGDPPPHH